MLRNTHDPLHSIDTIANALNRLYHSPKICMQQNNYRLIAKELRARFQSMWSLSSMSPDIKSTQSEYMQTSQCTLCTLRIIIITMRKMYERETFWGRCRYRSIFTFTATQCVMCRSIWMNGIVWKISNVKLRTTIPNKPSLVARYATHIKTIVRVSCKRQTRIEFIAC